MSADTERLEFAKTDTDTDISAKMSAKTDTKTDNFLSLIQCIRMVKESKPIEQFIK